MPEGCHMLRIARPPATHLVGNDRVAQGQVVEVEVVTVGSMAVYGGGPAAMYGEGW